MGIAKKAENSLLIPCKQGNLTVRPVPQDCDHHQEVAANRPGFPAPTIPRLFSALARRLMVCRDCSAGTTGPGPANAEMSLRRRILGSRLHGCVSGNPKGRPKREESSVAERIKSLLDTPIEYREGGRIKV